MRRSGAVHNATTFHLWVACTINEELIARTMANKHRFLIVLIIDSEHCEIVRTGARMPYEANLVSCAVLNCTRNTILLSCKTALSSLLLFLTFFSSSYGREQ